MKEIIATDFLKLRRRRGLWWTALALTPAAAVISALLVATNTVDSRGGEAFLDGLGGVYELLGAVMVVLVGARLGSEERAAGTLRYQLLTGVPRTRLYVSKLAVLVIACAAVAATGSVCGLLAALVVPGDGGDPVTVLAAAAFVWNQLTVYLVYGGIALGVGALFGSTGPAIAMALGLYLIGLNLVGLLTLIDPWFRHVDLSTGIDRLTMHKIHGDDAISLGAAIVVTVAWPAAFALAGWLKLRRIEA